LEEYGDKVQLVYRHYPLPFHPNAQKAAEASECVAKLGGNDAFWKYADAIFAKQTELGGQLNPAAITDAAAAAGVNAASFKTCLDSGEMAAAVKEDMDGGAAAGINGTPGTMIVTDDGVQELIPGAYPYEQVKTMIDKYL
jgi:protein-disulfide isomerase